MSFLTLDRATCTGLRIAMSDALRCADQPMTSDAAKRASIVELTMSTVTPGDPDLTHDAIDLAEALDVEIRCVKATTGMAYVAVDVKALGGMFSPETARIAAGLVGLFPRPRRGRPVWADAPVRHRGPVAPVEIAALHDALGGT